MWPRLPRRQVLRFLAVILAPCAVLLFLGLCMVEQEQQLQEKRASEQRQRRAVECSQGLLSRLERIKQDLAMGPAANLDEAIVFVGTVRNGRLLLPWDTNPDAQRFRPWIGEQALAGGIWRAEREGIAGRFDSAAEGYRQVIDAARRIETGRGAAQVPVDQHPLAAKGLQTPLHFWERNRQVHAGIRRHGRSGTAPAQLEAGCRRGMSRNLQDRVIGLVGRVLDGCQDVFVLQERIVGQDLLDGSSCSQQLEDIGGTNSEPANAGTPPALALFNRNSTEPVQLQIVLPTGPGP